MYHNVVFVLVVEGDDQTEEEVEEDHQRYVRHHCYWLLYEILVRPLWINNAWMMLDYMQKVKSHTCKESDGVENEVRGEEDDPCVWMWMVVEYPNNWIDEDDPWRVIMFGNNC